MMRKNGKRMDEFQKPLQQQVCSVGSTYRQRFTGTPRDCASISFARLFLNLTIVEDRSRNFICRLYSVAKQVLLKVTVI